MDNKIYAVLHGEKKSGPDPGMTIQGAKRVQSLRIQLPRIPSAVICGTGRRHHQTCSELGLAMTASTPIIGDPTSLDIIHGKRAVIFADGSWCHLDKDRSISDLHLSAQHFLHTLKDNTVLCTGRPFLKALGQEKATSSSVILIKVDYDFLISFKVLVSLGDTEDSN